MPFNVELTEGAQRDIDEIYAYIAEQDGGVRAWKVLEKLQHYCAALDKNPERGNVPKELRALGIDRYRELHYKPYRIIYRVRGPRVIVHCVVDGRRDMQSLLQRRLLR